MISASAEGKRGRQPLLALLPVLRPWVGHLGPASALAVGVRLPPGLPVGSNAGQQVEISTKR